MARYEADTACDYFLDTEYYLALDRNKHPMRCDQSPPPSSVGKIALNLGVRRFQLRMAGCSGWIPSQREREIMQEADCISAWKYETWAKLTLYLDL